MKSYKCGFVYFIYNAGLVKIGRTRDINKRLNTFRTTMPYMKVLQIIYTDDMYKLEKHYHTIYKPFRVRGEWFMFHEKHF